MTGPRFAPVDEPTGDLLDLIANDETPLADDWTVFLDALHAGTGPDGRISPNSVRPLLRGRIAPKRIGAFYHRAASEGLIRPDGWTVSSDHEGRNSGKPARVYRWCAS